MTGFADNDDCGDDHEDMAMVVVAMMLRIVVVALLRGQFSNISFSFSKLHGSIY